MPPDIRLATPEDAAAVREIYAPYVERTPISFELEPPTVDEMRARIESTLVTMPWLVAVEGGSTAGYAYASAHRVRTCYQWSVDVAVYVREGLLGAGIGKALYGALLPMLAEQGFINAYAGITLPNDASVGLHRRMGFEAVGVYRRVGYKLGKWHDVSWWHLALRDAPESPEPPRALGLIDFR